MTRLTFFAHDGARFDVDAENGSTVMENAIRNAVPGIEAECGGACACATCHVYVDPDWVDRLIPMSDEEEERLDDAMAVKSNSRLSCQLLMSEELDGLRVRLAPGSEPEDLAA